jgi:myo-inositol 2-dehydrogenase/D-chiro-inositol 1-dehydrogenase
VGLGPRTPIRSVEPGVPAPAGPAWPDFLDRFRAAYAAELATFVRVANGDEPSPCTERDGVEALRIAEAATRSLHEHRPVALRRSRRDRRGPTPSRKPSTRDTRAAGKEVTTAANRSPATPS